MTNFEDLISFCNYIAIGRDQTNKRKRRKVLGFNHKTHWKESIDLQIDEMQRNHKEKMKMNKV